MTEQRDLFADDQFGGGLHVDPPGGVLVGLTPAPPEGAIRFSVDGDPKPQGSKRIGRTKAGLPIIIDDNDARLRPWRDRVHWAARQAFEGIAPLAGPVALRLEFRMSRPKNVPKERRGRPATKPDIDKLERAVLDALTGIAFRDDAQVCWVQKHKIYADALQRPGVHIEIVRM